MRLSQLFEYGQRPQTVTVPLYHENMSDVDTGEPEIEFQATFQYTVERDPFGTGDSPTEYHMEIVNIVGADGKQYSIDAFTPQELKQAELEAHERLE